MSKRTSTERPRRAAYDYYPTPPEAVRALLSVEQFEGTIWEPACGDGAISKELIAAGYAVTSSDLVNRGYGQGRADFLKETRPRGKNIITNPPYGRGLADRFVQHALDMTSQTGGTVAMLLNLASLSHPLRHELWTHRPPSALYAIDELICWPNGNPDEAGYRTAQHRYVWTVWRPTFTADGRPTFWWLRMKDFRRRRRAGQSGRTATAKQSKLTCPTTSLPSSYYV